MNDKLAELCAERDALVIEAAKIADFVDEYTQDHDPRKWAMLPVLTDLYSKICQNQNEIEALFKPEPKKSFLKRLLRK